MTDKKVKDCPHRVRNNYAERGTGDPVWWINDCKIQEHPSYYPNPRGIECHLHGNCNLGKCKVYNEWSIKQVDDAFKQLEEAEAHRDAVLGVLRM
jgi:hypothetical protein